MKDYNNYKKFNLSIKIQSVENFLSSLSPEGLMVIIAGLSFTGLSGVLL